MATKWAEYKRKQRAKAKLEQGIGQNGEVPVVNRFIEQICSACKRVWNSYTPLSECPYCKSETGAVMETVSMVVPEEDETMPKGGDKELWEYAKERAARAKAYARKMPKQVMPSEKVFQKVAWQYTELIRYQK
jgi:hypothetical protein